jgi:hypothetical protein
MGVIIIKGGLAGNRIELPVGIAGQAMVPVRTKEAADAILLRN